jgi:hypothetical protein
MASFSKQEDFWRDLYKPGAVIVLALIVPEGLFTIVAV